MQDTSIFYDPVFYDPLQGHPFLHDPLNSLVGPRPIGWISTLGMNGIYNLAPYSFFNLFNYTPPIIGFSSVGQKDTLKNITKNKEFVWNLVSRPLAEAMNITSAAVPEEVDEFSLAGLEAAACKKIDAPRVKDSLASFECRLSQLIQLEDSYQKKISSWLILGEVVGVHIHHSLIKKTDAGHYVDGESARVVLRGGGASAFWEISSHNRFDMKRPVL